MLSSVKTQTVFVRQMLMPGRPAVNLQPNFLGLSRWRRSLILSDASATSVRRLPAAAPKAAFGRLTFGRRPPSRAKSLHFPERVITVLYNTIRQAKSESTGAEQIAKISLSGLPHIVGKLLKRRFR